MPIIVLIPSLICIYALYRVSVQKVFLNLVIPVFFLFPTYYYWKVAALPPIDLAESVLFPLGVAIVIKEIRHWRFSVMDLFIALFLFTCFYADYLQEKATTSVFELFFSLSHVLVPYIAGKLLIEQNGQRAATVRRIVFSLFVASIISAWEYKMGQNPFTLLTARYFPDEHFGWHTSIRWGFGRVSGPYGQSELAGMVFFFGLVLALWLGYNHLWEPKFSRVPWLPWKKANVITFALGFTLLMTQARGPWIGAIAAVPIAFLGRSRRVLRSAVLLSVFFVVFGSIFYVALKKYSNPNAATESTEQENAQYRAQLLDHYWPVAKEGGAWGWGVDFPRIAGQGSIDNQYLFISLVQGMVGLAAFIAIAAGTVYSSTIAAIYNHARTDRYFAFSILGVMVGLIVTLFTVFLGNQSYEIFFLLAGWSQSLRTRPIQETQMVFEQVYT